LKKNISVIKSEILILGFTFKENCPDVRNTKVIDIFKELKQYNTKITIYDPWADPKLAKKIYDVDITNELPTEKFDAIILAVAHKEFLKLTLNNLLKKKRVVFDVKGILNKKDIDSRL